MLAFHRHNTTTDPELTNVLEKAREDCIGTLVPATHVEKKVKFSAPSPNLTATVTLGVYQWKGEPFAFSYLSCYFFQMNTLCFFKFYVILKQKVIFLYLQNTPASSQLC